MTKSRQIRILALAISKQLHSTPFDQTHVAKQSDRLVQLLTEQKTPESAKQSLPDGYVTVHRAVLVKLGIPEAVIDTIAQ